MRRAFEKEKFSGKLSVITGFFNDPEKTIESTQDIDLNIVLGGFTCENKKYEMKETVKIAASLSDKYIYILSYQDLIYVDSSGFEPESFEIIQWLNSQYISATITFTNFARYVFTNGQIPLDIKEWGKGKKDFRLAYEGDVKLLPKYDGRFGYAINALNHSDEMIYNQHSCSIKRGDKPIILNVNGQGIEVSNNGKII